MKYIKKDDDFGVIKTLRELYKKRFKTYHDSNMEYELNNRNDDMQEFMFNNWMNQFLPPAFYETRGTIQRHIDQIKNITYNPTWVWIKRNNQYSCAVLTDQLYRQIKDKEVSLPIYQEIEEEKQKWQATPNYRKEAGKSEPLKEEYVQLVIQRR